MIAFLLAALGAALLALVLRAATRREARTGRHGRRRGVRVGTPTEIRRHRRGCRERAWAGTRTVCARPTSTSHVLDEGSVYRVSNLIESTGEITMADLEALLGPRPEPIGVSA